MYGGFDLLAHSVLLGEKAQNYYAGAIKAVSRGFSRTQTSNKSCQCKRSRLNLLILDNKK